MTQISSTSSTIIFFPPGYDGPSVAKKSGGLDVMCTKQQSPQQCSIATIKLALPTPPPSASSGTKCTNPNKNQNCPPTNSPAQPSILNVNVMSVAQNKSGILPNCKGCVDLKAGMQFQVFYQCFDPGCC